MCCPDDKKFWDWFDNMLAYSMYVFVGSGFIFIFCHAYLDFFSNLHGYSVAQWLVTAYSDADHGCVPLDACSRFRRSLIMIFGGVGGVARGFANAIQGLIVRAYAASFCKESCNVTRNNI